MSNERRGRVFWSAQLADWETSGTSLREFASARDLSVRTLSWWRWRLRKDGESPSLACSEREVRLLPVVVEDEAPVGRLGALEVELPGPVVLRFAAGAQISAVAAVVRAAIEVTRC